MPEPNLEHRAGRMLRALIDSGNRNARMHVTVQVEGGGRSFHDTFELRKWVGRSGDTILFVSLPETADWSAEPPVKPVTPLSVNLRTWDVREQRADPRVDDLVVYAARAALRLAVTGAGPQPTNGTVRVVEQAICGACGLPLTDPESIRKGIGPNCEEKLTGKKRSKRSRKMTTRAAKRSGQQELS